MATKTYTMYSTNPKMDTSGITAKRPRSEFVPTKNGGKMVPLEPQVVTGGMLYKKAVKEQENFRKDRAITQTKSLKEGAAMVSAGTSPYMAMDILEERVEARDNYNTCSYWD